MKARRLESVSAETDVPTFARHLPVTRAAIAFASHLHSTQRRVSDEAPFILHPLEVGSLLYNTGASDRVVAAGVLHDVIEDTSAVIEEIRQRFGGHIAALVSSLTEDPAIEPERERKAALRARVRSSGTEVALIFAADKLAKVRELRIRITQADGALTPDIEAKLDHYAASLRMLEEALAEEPLVRQLRFELEALQTLPPGTQTHDLRLESRLGART
jgi:(p)ppGpp synthase/HD superfamily hydrolase